MTTSSNTRVLLELNLASILISSTAVWAKLIEASPEMTILVRLFFAAFSLTLFLVIRRNKFRLANTKEYIWMCITGWLMTIHWVTYFYAAIKSTVAIAIITLFAYPVITLFIEPFLIHKPFRFRSIISGLLVLLGIYIMQRNFEWSSSMMIGFMSGLFSAIVYAFRNVLTKKYFSHYLSTQVMMYQVWAGIVLLLPILFFQKLDFSFKEIAYLFVLGVVCTTIAHSLYVKSFFKIPLYSASIISSLQPIYATIIAFIILGEKPSTQTIIGGCVVIFAVLYEVFKLNKKSQASN